MDIYCSSCKKNTANKDSSVRRTEQNISMFVSNCASFSKKRSKSIKNQEASGLLSELRISLWCCVCWQEDLAIRTVSGNVLKDRAYEIPPNLQCDYYQRGLASMVYTFFDKKMK